MRNFSRLFKGSPFVAVAVLLASGVVGVAPGGAYTAFATLTPDFAKCTLATGYPTTPVGANVMPSEDGAPQKTCVKTTVSLLGATDSTLPKKGQAGRVKVSFQADAALLPGAYRVVIKFPNGWVQGPKPAGFTSTTFDDPFSPKAQPNSGDDGSHSYQLTGNVNLAPGKTTTLFVPMMIAEYGYGTTDVLTSILKSSLSSVVNTNESQEFVWGAQASYTYDATGTRPGIVSFPDERTQQSPADWNVEEPGSLDLPARELTGWDSSKVANYKRPTVPLDTKGNCPGGGAKQANGVCPAVTGSGGLTNGLVPSARTGNPSIRRAHTAGTTCMDGQLVYSDLNGTHPSINVPVEAWDVNSTTDDHIGNAMTDWDGNFHICFSNAENSFFDSGTADVQLIFRSTTNRFRVVNNCCASTGLTPGSYNLKTSTRNNVPSGTISLGAMTSSDSSFQKAYHAYDELNQAWAWSNSHSPGSGTCWSNGDCNQKTVMWWPDSLEWPHYGGCAINYLSKFVCLPGIGPDDVHVVYHEIGHNVMHDTYGSMPAHSCPSTHYGWVNEERGCAWTESWPSWYASAIEGIPNTGGYRTTTPVANDNMGWSTYTGVARGANVENRIVMALWDIQDSNNEGVWDRMTTGDQVLWDAFRLHQPQDWEGMITALSLEGVDTNSSDFRSTLYGNTIDMADNPFRDPLSTISWASRTLPPVSAPGLNSVNAGADAPGTNSAVPVNTSNDHAFKWSRTGPSLCTDTIDVQSIGNWASGYQQNGRSSFSYNGFTVSAYSNSSMTNLLATVSTGATSLWSVGSLTLSLPDSPTVYVKVSGQSRATPVLDGIENQVPTSMYKIRANSCNLFTIANPWAIFSSTLSTSAVQLSGGKSYTATWTPTGKSLTGKAQKVSLSVGSQGWSSPCVNDTQTGFQCTRTTVGSPFATATSTSSNAGRSLSLNFTTKEDGLFEFLFKSSTGLGAGKVSIKLR